MELLGISKQNEKIAVREGWDQSVKGLEYQIQLIDHSEAMRQPLLGFRLG